MQRFTVLEVYVRDIDPEALVSPLRADFLPAPRIFGVREVELPSLLGYRVSYEGYVVASGRDEFEGDYRTISIIGEDLFIPHWRIKADRVLPEFAATSRYAEFLVSHLGTKLFSLKFSSRSSIEVSTESFWQ